MSEKKKLIVSGGTHEARQQIISLLSDRYCVREDADAEPADAGKFHPAYTVCRVRPENMPECGAEAAEQATDGETETEPEESTDEGADGDQPPGRRAETPGTGGEACRAAEQPGLTPDIPDSRAREKRAAFERDGLLEALGTAYSLIIAVNLTENNYHILMYEHFTTRKAAVEGAFDELVACGASTVPEEDRAAFAAAFSRESLLAAFVRGEDSVRLEHRQTGDDGRLHWTETVVLRVPNAFDGDVLELTLARCVDAQKSDEEKLHRALELATGQLRQRLYYTDLINAVAPGLIMIQYDDPAARPVLFGNLPGMLGYTAEESAAFFSGNYDGLVPAEDLEKVRRLETGLKKADVKRYAEEFRVRKKDGGIAYIMATGTRFSDHAGEGYVRVMTDHTEQHRMAERIRIIEEEVRLTVSQTGKTVCRYDVDGETLILPAAYARAMDLPAELKLNAAGEAALEKVYASPEDVRAHQAFFQAIRRGDASGTAEAQYVAKDGRRFFQRADFLGVFDENGRPVRAVISLEDTTAQHAEAAENARIRESERIMRAVAEHSARIVYSYDTDRREARALDAGQAEGAGLSDRYTGLPDSMIGTGGVLPDSAEKFAAFFADIHAGKDNGQVRLHLRAKDGAVRWFDVRFSVLRSESGRLSGAVLSFLDITARHEEELSYARYRQSIETGEKSSLLLHIEADITADLLEKADGRSEPRLSALAGSGYSSALQKIVEQAFEPEEKSRAQAYFSREHLLALFADGIRETQEDWQLNLTADRQRHWGRVLLQFVTDPYTAHVRVFALVRDVTREKKEQLAVVLRAERDGMTGLLNRATTEASIRAWLGSADAKSKTCMMIFLDLDGLKEINDTFGHAQGDRALIGIAETLRAHFRSTDIIGRTGGDEFLVFLTGVSDETAMSANVLLLLRKISRRTVGEQDEHQIRCSAGCVIASGEGETFESLFAKADTALYHVKRSGRNDFAFYTPRMQLTDYRYERHAAGSLKDSELFDPGEIKQLIRSLSSFFPLVLSTNLSKNSMYTMESDGYINSGMPRSATVDEFVTAVARTVHPDDRAAFSRHISRRALLAAYAEGRPSLHFFVRQEDDGGRYQWVEVIILFYRNEDGDACEFTLARASEEKRKDQELLSLHKLSELAVGTGYEYVCLVHPESGVYELYGNDGKNTHTIPKTGDFDEVTRLIRDTHVVAGERGTYYNNAIIAHVAARMKENNGQYRYRYTLTDGVREAAFYYFEPTHSDLLMTVRRVKE